MGHGPRISATMLALAVAEKIARREEGRKEGSMDRRTLTVLTIVAAAVMVSPGARASSDDAWAAFRADVEAACLKTAEPLFASAAARVDPFGSQSYGLALVTGKAKGADSEATAICVYDKQVKTVEIGGELPPP
jgi:hypothetical protein